MASIQQLNLILEQAQHRENDAMQSLQQAALELQQQEQALTQLSKYRFSYLHQMRNDGQAGIKANSFSQLQHYIAKLDGLVVKQELEVSNYRRAKLDRQQRWQQARQKKEALQLLIDKNLAEFVKKANKAEQKMMDEFATNQFARRSRAVR